MTRQRSLYFWLSACLLMALVIGLAPKAAQAPQAGRGVSMLGPAGQGGGPEQANGGPTAGAPVQGPFFGQSVVPASFDGDVRDLPQIGPTEIQLLPELDVRRNALLGTTEVADSAVQTTQGALAMPSPSQNFAGLDFQTWGGGWPPDTNGDVGPNHYIQTVNVAIGIYNKTGTQLAAFTFNTLFTGTGVTGTPCDNDNNGDPVVLYDPYSDRWIITDFAWANDNDGPYYECIAVSKTADPVSGGWWFYALNAGTQTGDPNGDWLNDYPKLGVWQDGIYMGQNMFDMPSGAFKTARVYAFNRTQLINGQTLTPVYFDVPDVFSIFPSNYRGTPPPNGTPNYFIGLSPFNYTSLVMYKFTPNWNNLGASTFTGPQSIAVSTYSDLLTDVPQSGSVMSLDSLSGRIMVQNQYRNINGTESLWTNHTVSSGGTAGIRWYEIRNLNSTPTVHQQSTFAPADGVHRWMGSLAVDKVGNMALGYSASNGSMFPAIRYAGRLVSDTLGTLGQSESTLITGGGAQTLRTRWGDYSAMTVDPVDDCTFWYTTEYYATTGTDWQTRIASFKFPSCTTAPAVSSLSSQMVLSNTVVGPLAFTVSDSDTPIGNITITASSNNQTVVPNANVVLGGSGTNRTVTVTPASNQTGTAGITISANDGTAVTTSVFTVTFAAQIGNLYLPLVSRNYSAPPPAFTTIVQENFEGSFPGSWQLSDTGPNAGEYYWGKRTCQAYAGSYSGWGVGGGANGSGLGCGANYPVDVDAFMIYGPFSLADATSADLSYQLWLNSESGYDGVCRLASTDGVNFNGTCTSGTTGWTSRTLDLSNVNAMGSLLGQPNVWVALEFYSDLSVTLAEGGYVDDIVLRKCTAATCTAAPLPALPESEGPIEFPVYRVLTPKP